MRRHQLPAKHTIFIAAVSFILVCIRLHFMLSHSTCVVEPRDGRRSFLPYFRVSRSSADHDHDDGCQRWDPHAPVEQDPPGCLRARQLRQIGKFRRDIDEEGVWLSVEQHSAIRQLEHCALGVLSCPPRPLVVSDHWDAYVAHDGYHGERIWMLEVHHDWELTQQVDATRDLGYVLLTVNGFDDLAKSWRILNGLELFLHMYWSNQPNLIQCLSDPRCVRPEDYRPAANETIRHDLSVIPQKDIGKLPLWRAFTIEFWGTRPGDAYKWGLPSNEEPWSVHPLGTKWQLTPFAYPEHTWLPLSIERRCLSSSKMHWEDRNNSVIVLAKRSEYFHEGHLPSNELAGAFPEIFAELKEAGIDVYHNAKAVDVRGVPDGMIELPDMNPLQYVKTLSGMRAMLAIGSPPISPTPYEALCLAVPVVMPALRLPIQDGWEGYNRLIAQHGPVQKIGEPYVYNYNMTDPSDLVRQIKRAVDTPIQPYVPYENSIKGQQDTMRKALAHDWETDYRRVIENNGGVVPYIPDATLQFCFDTDQCKRVVRMGDYDDRGVLLPEKQVVGA